jgi:uracil-DNA glycosylase
MAWLTLGKEAAQSALQFALGEKAPESLDEALRHNARTVPWSGRPIFILHTYHPSATLRNENTLPHVYDHLDLLIRWLDGHETPVTRPRIVRPFHPRTL